MGPIQFFVKPWTFLASEMGYCKVVDDRGQQRLSRLHVPDAAPITTEGNLSAWPNGRTYENSTDAGFSKCTALHTAFATRHGSVSRGLLHTRALPSYDGARMWDDFVTNRFV